MAAILQLTTQFNLVPRAIRLSRVARGWPWGRG